MIMLTAVTPAKAGVQTLNKTLSGRPIVIPAKAGIQSFNKQPTAALAAVPQIPCFRFWTPAFAGVTVTAR